MYTDASDTGSDGRNPFLNGNLRGIPRSPRQPMSPALLSDEDRDDGRSTPLTIAQSTSGIHDYRALAPKSGQHPHAGGDTSLGSVQGDTDLEEARFAERVADVQDGIFPPPT